MTPDRLSAAEVAAEIARSRATISRRLAGLDRDYALRHLVVRAVRLARKSEIDTAAIGDALRRDAAPLALIGLGLGWLGLAGRAAGKDVLQQLMSGLATVQRLAEEFGLTTAPHEAPADPAAPPPPPAIPDRGSTNSSS